MFARIVYYIRSTPMGRFVGECMGLAFFECHIEDGTLSPKEEPVQFESEEQAQVFLDSWTGGAGDCFVEEGIG